MDIAELLKLLSAQGALGSQPTSMQTPPTVEPQSQEPFGLMKMGQAMPGQFPQAMAEPPIMQPGLLEQLGGLGSGLMGLGSLANLFK